MKPLLILPLLSLTLSCGSPSDGTKRNKGEAVSRYELPPAPPSDLRSGPRPKRGQLPPEDTEIGWLVPNSDHYKVYYCGDIGFVDTGSAADKPAYYFRRKDGFVIGRCGGSCMIDMPPGRCARECPPPQWTCSMKDTEFSASRSTPRRSR
ncbi:MAG TPA: hypothetical protein VF574_07555 [Allosphingosinicella sp.]|jgi:hypothetical protein